jgi:threonine dehydratase
MTKACSRGMSLGMDQLALDVQQKATPTDPAWYTAIRFPPCDHMDVIHGHGTIALDFERELATLTQGSPTRPVGVESFPDFVIGDMDNGVTLSGICMAFAGTRTQVLGAAPVSGFWEHASKWYSSDIPPEENYEHKYWEGIDVPMADIPWATFRAPGNLSGVFEVDNNHMYAASIAAREHYGLFLEPEEVVPLAVALYNEEFRRLVAQASQACGEDEPTIGIILRSRRAKRLVPVAPKNC